MLNLITVDGPSASGKSTLSLLLAQKLGWHWLSTGILYRGFAFIALNQNTSLEEQIVNIIHQKKWDFLLDSRGNYFLYRGKDISSHLYSEEVDDMASQVAGYPDVRKALLPVQRDYSKKYSSGLVAEGRDCGTVVFPNASLKIYLIAKAEVRAERRLLQRGHPTDVSHIIQSQQKRDTKDSYRLNSPLRQPQGAFIINTGQCHLKEALEKAYKKSCEVLKIP